MPFQLKKSFFEPGASVNWIQVDHRRTAIEYAVAATKLLYEQNIAQFPDDALFAELESIMPVWVVETIAQGAYIREYHLWEKDVKEYFGRHLKRNDAPPGHLNQKSGETFVQVSRRLLALFGIPDMDVELESLDGMRVRVNSAKHDPGLLLNQFVTIEEYWGKLDSIERFWEIISTHEDFT